MEIIPIPDSPDHLAIIQELAEDPLAPSVAAQIPGHDAWTPMGGPLTVSHPDFPVGRVHEHLEGVIAYLPHAIEECLTGQATLAPSRIAMAKYLGLLTAEQERQIIEMQVAEQQESSEEEDPDLPTPEEELDRQLKERDDLRMSLIEERTKIDRATYHGFLDGKPPSDISLIRKDLERMVTIDDAVFTPVKNFIEQLVSLGCIVEDDPKERHILTDLTTKTCMREKDLTRSGIEYAQFLISLRQPKP